MYLRPPNTTRPYPVFPDTTLFRSFLTDVEVAEAADQPKPVELPGLLLEPADEKHLPVEINQLLPARLVPIWFVRPFAIGCRRGRGTACALGRRGFSGTSGRRGFRHARRPLSDQRGIPKTPIADRRSVV